MEKKNINRLLKILALVTSVQVTTTSAANFDIGTSQWSGSFPGVGTYNQTVENIQVTGQADYIVNVATDPTAVYSGNESPAINRTFSYTFPEGSTVSLDFFQLTLNSSNQPESIGNFSNIPDEIIIGTGHNVIGLDYRLEGSSAANINTTTTMTWQNISSLSFDIASNGNVALIGHRNLIVTANPRSVPLMSTWSILILVIGMFISAISFKQIRKGVNNA